MNDGRTRERGAGRRRMHRRPVVNQRHNDELQSDECAGSRTDDYVKAVSRGELWHHHLHFPNRSAAGHLFRVLSVPSPLHRDLRSGAVDLTQIVRRKFDRSRSNVLLHAHHLYKMYTSACGRSVVARRRSASEWIFCCARILNRRERDHHRGCMASLYKKRLRSRQVRLRAASSFHLHVVRIEPLRALADVRVDGRAFLFLSP